MAATKTLVLTLVILTALVVGPAAAPALAWHEGCDPENPCDPRPHSPSEVVKEFYCDLRRSVGLPC